MKKRIYLLLLLALVVVNTPELRAWHNTNRYFPLLEVPSDYIATEKTSLATTIFFATATTADRRGGGHTGVAGLWGVYDLKDVIASLQAVSPSADPIMDVTGDTQYAGKSMVFKVTGKIDAVGLTLQHNRLFGKGFSLGWSLPIMNVRSRNQFTFNQEESDNYFKYARGEELRHTQKLTIDHIRRVTHQAIGFKGNEYSQAGLGDLDLHARYNKAFDHVLMMKGIEICLQTGVTVPTGFLPKNDYPSSVPAMGDGHWSLYADAIGEFELKQDWKCGLMVGVADQLSDTQFKRISVGNEPTIFSALKGFVEIKPGVTFKVSPYFTLENIHDGLHFQGRYTYRHHSKDEWTDHRRVIVFKPIFAPNSLVPCYLSNSTLTETKEKLSKWSSHYFTLQLTYDCQTALKKLPLNPIFYATCDFPIKGDGLCNTTEVIVGAKLHF